jgi:hypothetical protein
MICKRINWEGCERKRQWPISEHCPGICMEGLKKMKTLSYDRLPSGQDLNPGPAEY